MEMEIVEAPGPHVKVALKGRLDTTGADRIESRMSAAIVPRGLNAIVDLSGVEFIGSMGVRMLISIARAAARMVATLKAAPGSAPRVRG